MRGRTIGLMTTASLSAVLVGGCLGGSAGAGGGGATGGAAGDGDGDEVYVGDGDGDEVYVGDGDGDVALGGGDPVAALNASIILPMGSYSLSNPVEDASITVSSPSAAMAEITPGGQYMMNLDFAAPSADVAGVGIRFGSTGPIQVAPVAGAVGNASGQLTLPFAMDPSLCDSLSQICHDIRCYEFAVTDAGTISAANIRDVALACNGCNEPSCQSLLDSCDAGTCDSTTTAGSDSPETHTFDLGTTSGTFDFTYDSYSQEDQIIVEYEGSVLLDTGCVGAMETVPLTYSGSTTSVTVTVNPNCNGGTGTSWDFSVGCPI